MRGCWPHKLWRCNNRNWPENWLITDKKWRYKLKKVVNTLDNMHPIASGATIGIIGGGQLGKMLAQSAKEQGYRVVVLDPAADCVANGVCDAQVVAAYDDVAALLELAKQVDVLTFEFENIDAHALQQAMAHR